MNMNIRPHISKSLVPRTAGAVLVELTCAIFIITVGVFGALQMYSLAISKTRSVNEYGLAGRVLTNEIETLRAAPFDSLTNGPAPFRSKTPELSRLVRAETAAKIADCPEVPNLKVVQVKVRWKGEQGRWIEKRLETMIAKKR